MNREGRVGMDDMPFFIESISPRAYAQAFGCSRYRAELDLKRFVEEGVLARVGYRNKVMYLLSNDSV